MPNLNATEKQNERILARLRQGPVTSCELTRELDILRPASRIFDLRSEGHHIVMHWTYDRINGTDHRVGRYVLLPKEPDPGNAKGPDSAPHRTEAHKAKTSNENSTSIVREAASFSLLAFIVVWSLGSAMLGMAESSTTEVVLMTAGVGADGR